ncbi:MAG TPA: hypothetical protein PK199_02925 [Bacteroidales bacterium]|nr:hypothetical protein [Bacteroidales bacterium]
MKTIQLSICDSFPKNCIINNSFRALYIILTLLLLCLHNEVKPQNNTIGAGSYEVYTGSAFHIRQLMDSSQWSYVRRIGDGIFWHPVGY